MKAVVDYIIEETEVGLGEEEVVMPTARAV